LRNHGLSLRIPPYLKSILHLIPKNGKIIPNLSFEQPVGLSGANPHETRKLGLFTSSTSSEGEWDRMEPQEHNERVREGYSDMDGYLTDDLG